jgi:hypothetical protein
MTPTCSSGMTLLQIEGLGNQKRSELNSSQSINIALIYMDFCCDCQGIICVMGQGQKLLKKKKNIFDVFS